MTLKEFIAGYDYEGSVVLLEGKRLVKEADKPKLEALGRLLASSTSKMIFRSGNASGADYYFSLGVASVDKTRLQVITPYKSHRQKSNQAYYTISLDEVNLAAEPEVIYHTTNSYKKMGRLIEQYLSGARDPFSIKAAYILRDTVKVLGADEIRPTSFGIFYDDLNNPKEGGTGHTIRVCENCNIPYVNQKTWLTWL